MPPRAEIAELVQLGVETTYGTSVAASRKLGGFTIALAPEAVHTRLRPKGFKYPTLNPLNREWASGAIAGFPVYDEMPYLFSSLLETVAVSTTTGVSTWTFNPDVSSVETVKSYTVEEGDAATRAHKVTGVVVTGLGMDYPREGDPSLTGTVIGQRLQDGITPTASLSTVTLQPITAPELDVFVDATLAGLGTTKLLSVMRAAWNIGDMWAPQWVLNSALTSFKTIVQGDPSGTVTLAIEADATGMAHLTQMRSAASVFIRMKATSIANIPGGTPSTPYSLQCDFACKVAGPPRFVNIGGVRCAEWTYEIVFDPTGNAANRFVVVGGLAAL